jgi:PAS domain S-box-containing protein
MELFRKVSDTRTKIAAIVSGVLLIGYIIFLVGMNYVSQLHLQESALEKFRQDMEKRATAIGYFFSERKNDLKHLTQGRDISSFFENKALGMSMEYGLRASLLGISKNFDRLLADRKFDEDKIFDRIILIDSHGKLLVNSRPQGASQIPENGWKRFLAPEHSDAVIIILQDRPSLKLMVSISCFFKNKYAAQIVAWISPKILHRLVKAAGESSGRSLYIVSRKILFPIHVGMPDASGLTDLPHLDTLEIGKTYRFNAVDKDGTGMDMLAGRVLIKKTSLSLVSLAPSTEVFGTAAPWHLPLAMGVLAIIVLGGIVMSLRINAQKLILHARLEEVSRREQEIQDKNRLLKREVTHRERAEEALKKAHDELEVRIKERTRELAESNLLLKREIKQREQAENIIRESEERYRRVFENTGTATVIIEQDTTISMANTEFEMLSGWSKEELEGRMSWTQFMVQEDLEKMKDSHVKKREENGYEKSRQYEFRFVDKQGNVKNVLNKIAMIPGTGKTIASLLDITPQKRGERALEREKEKFRVLVEKSPLGISIIQEDGQYKYINPMFVEIFGYTLEDVPNGREWFRKACPEQKDRKRLISTWISDLKRLRGGEVRTRTFTVTCKDGSQKVVLFRAVTTETGDQFVIYEDITEKRRLEAQLQQAQKMEAIGTLAGGIAHDFNNFLQIISGYTELLMIQNHMAPGDIDNLKQIKNSTIKASELTKRLLIFSRKVETNLRPIDLNQAVREVCELLGRTIPRMIDVEFQGAEGLKIINGDPVLLEQVVMNLSLNAKDAMPEGGRLVFETANVVLDEEYSKTHLGLVPGEYVLLSISDTGYGMDRETQEHIFEPFFSTKGIGKGTGLGLAMVYGIVKNHGGYIMCYSEPGEGTLFKIYLPVIQLEIIEPEEGKKAEVIQGGRETILLVDDENAILDTGNKKLTRYGYHVITAQSGEEAIEIIRNMDSSPDLVVLDLNMPGMGGNKSLEILLEINPGIKVIIASGYSDSDHVKEARDSGAAGFIAKPYQLSDMLKRIREVLDAE